MEVLLLIILSTFLVSFISFIGVITLFVEEKLLNKILLLLVSLSAGALMGGAFLHLIPESIDKFSDSVLFIYVLAGFTLLFFIERILNWRHCHKDNCLVHTFAYTNLVGDGVHNFIDGLIIAASFLVNIHLGIVTTIAVALHEIPQELGDFGVLIYAGFSKSKALFLNFIVAITAILGGVIGYFLSSANISTTFLLPFAAGGFIYIAASDLIPEIKKEVKLKNSLINLGVFVLGILIIYGVRLIK